MLRPPATKLLNTLAGARQLPVLYAGFVDIFIMTFQVPMFTMYKYLHSMSSQPDAFSFQKTDL